MLGCMVTNKVSNTLIVVPPALINQWKDAIKRFAPEFIMGHTNKKATVWKVIFKNGYYCPNATQDILSGKMPFHLFELQRNTVWITHMELLLTERMKMDLSIMETQMDRIIFDEAHHMRTRNKHNYKGAKKAIPAKSTVLNGLFTGTPIQNYTQDYHSLVSLLGTTDFKFEKANDFVLQRTKDEVGIKMPSKTVPSSRYKIRKC